MYELYFEFSKLGVIKNKSTSMYFARKQPDFGDNMMLDQRLDMLSKVYPKYYQPRKSSVSTTGDYFGYQMSLDKNNPLIPMTTQNIQNYVNFR